MDLSSPFAALLAKFNRYDGVLNAAANESAPRDTGIEILGIDPRAHTKEKLAAPAPLPPVVVWRGSTCVQPPP